MTLNGQTRRVFKLRFRNQPALAAVAEVLVAKSSALGYEIDLAQNPVDGYSGSSHDKDAKTITVVTHEADRVRPPEAILVSLAHELGHIEDPPTSDDQQVQRGTRAFYDRRDEREETAWCAAEDMLSGLEAWDEIEPFLRAAEDVAKKRYAEDRAAAGY